MNALYIVSVRLKFSMDGFGRPITTRRDMQKKPSGQMPSEYTNYIKFDFL